MQPTILTIFGVTGDLANRKLFPALHDLFLKGVLPKELRIIGFARKENTDESFRTIVLDSIKKKNPNTLVSNEFLSLFSYVRGELDDRASYDMLSSTLEGIDRDFFKTPSLRLFFLSVPPTLYETVARLLARPGLMMHTGGESRILLEKPFGRDAETAEKLDSLLGSLFNEKQIFRIDHYLAKETVQNILTFRFSNTLFEKIWNKDHIERVEIFLHEKIDLGTRGNFYTDVGALRDVGQNHMLQMLALIAMEPPERFSPEGVREERARVLESLVVPTEEQVAQFVRAEYDGARTESGLGMETETFFRIHATVNSDRFRGVPFILESGKALSESKAEIRVKFKKEVRGLCSIGEEFCDRQNTLVFRIQPDEAITLSLWVKDPGLLGKMREQTLVYAYPRETGVVFPDAYEKVFFDALMGNLTLFASSREVKASWHFITPILTQWTSLPLLTYKKGSSANEIV